MSISLTDQSGAKPRLERLFLTRLLPQQLGETLARDRHAWGRFGVEVFRFALAQQLFTFPSPLESGLA